jgi:hypothetical protein
VLDDAIDATAAWTAAKAGAQFGEIIRRAGGYHFDFTVFSIADPPAQGEFAGFAMHIPAEAYALDTTLNQKMKNHCQ